MLTSRRVTLSTGQFPEELVYVRSSDDVVNGGVMFKPPKDARKPVAIVWMRGWGVNFYSPTYVNIGRRLAEGGSRLSPSTPACTISEPSRLSASANGFVAAAIGAFRAVK